MGLDGVEIIMAVEEAFDIEIRDEEAEQLGTVGQIYALVVSKLALAPSQPILTAPRRCPSSVRFYEARRALIALHGAERRHITPSTLMDRLLPRRRRRTHWQDLGWVLGVRLPDLELPALARRLLTEISLTLLLTGFLAYLTHPVSLAIPYTLLCVLLAWASHQIAAPFAVRIPAECATVGDTVRTILLRRPDSDLGPARVWHPTRVWETLRGIIVEQLAVPPEAVTMDAHLVHDLGCD